MDLTEVMLHSEEIYKGKIIRVRRDRVRLPNGKESTREVVEHSGGVCILALDETGCTYVVRQYRYAFETELLELPAGKLEPGEDPAECAARELEEETGLRAEKLEYLGQILPSPGFSREVLHAYLATGLSQGKPRPDEDEFLTVRRLPLDALYRMVLNGSVRDAKTVFAVLKAKALQEN